MADPLAVGSQLGSYLIESVIGRGGMSTVYRARHSRLGTDVALKVLATDLSSDDAFRERFLREAKMAAGIDHPNVVPIYDMGLHEDSLYLVMRYVAGGDLKSELRASRRLSPELTVEILAPIARALDAAHAHGLVHRDVKPANILLQRDDTGAVEHVYLSDFGITKHVSSVSGLTGTGAMIGTVDYMAPEQIESGAVSARTDVYALGCVFYQCLTGRPPFERDADMAVLWAHVHEDPAPPSAIVKACPHALDGVIAKAMAKSPDDRYPSCRAFAEACAAALGTPDHGLSMVGAPTVADVIPEPAPEAPEPEREPVLAAAAPAASPPPSESPPRERSWLARNWWVVPAAVVLIGGAFGLGSALSSGGSSSSSTGSTSATTATTAAGERFPGTLDPVPTNRVTGTGKAVLSLDGHNATITIDTDGLLDGAPHAMHIHAGGQGECPPASAAHDHNGHETIATTDGVPFYGSPKVAVTTRGDTTLNSILAFRRFPNTGEIRYKRTFPLPASVVQQIRRDNAVIVIHGIDYNHNGVYDGVLDRSELNRTLPGESTAPGLCGPLVQAAPGTNGASTTPPGKRSVYVAELAVQAGDELVCRL